MITIDEYHQPTSLTDAYSLLTDTKRKTAIIGGGTWLALGSNRRLYRAIDLAHFHLDQIEDKGDHYEIGAMTSFGALMDNRELRAFAQGIIPKSVGDIVGVQLRNMVTVGGTVAGRYGFSDLLTSLLALGASLIWHQRGKMSLEEYLALPARFKDILLYIIIPKGAVTSSWQAMRNSRGDFALLNVAVVKRENEYSIAVGARPQRALLSRQAMALANKGGNHLSSAVEQVASIASSEMHFGTNTLASGDYRRLLCQALVKRGFLEVTT